MDLCFAEDFKVTVSQGLNEAKSIYGIDVVYVISLRSAFGLVTHAIPIQVMPEHVNLDRDVQKVLISPKMIFKLTRLDS